MASKSSFLLALLLIANPFMLLFFQNCTSSVQDRAIASTNETDAKNTQEAELILQVAKNLKIK